MAVDPISEQLCLPGIKTASEPAERLFFGGFPERAAAECIAQLAHNLKNKHRLPGEPLRKKRFHISLCRLRPDTVGLREDLVNRAIEAISAIALPPFEVVFDRAVSFSGGHTDPERPDSYPLVLLARDGVAELTALRRSLIAAMVKAGIKPRGNTSFTPHITLLYDRQHEIAEVIEPIRWTIRDFVLVRSLLGQTRYELLHRWQLSGRRPVHAVSKKSVVKPTLAG
ncbi:MAG TPA: 2'-5' RNA ligase family protein [Acidobacteriaceae bacterium]